MDKNRPLNSLRRWRNCFRARLRSSSAETVLAQAQVAQAYYENPEQHYPT